MGTKQTVKITKRSRVRKDGSGKKKTRVKK